MIGGYSENNVAPGVHGATIGGGGAASVSNQVSDNFGTVAGGYFNRAGGVGSVFDQGFGTVGGGRFNHAMGAESTVGGGDTNLASGFQSTVPGGAFNTAGGDLSFAAGFRAKATADGSFMWADSRNVDFGVPVPNFFGVRATGGVGFTVAIAPSGGGTQYCDLLPGVVGWQCVSDRNQKENFVAARGEEILAKLAAMPLFSWNFKGTDPAIRNLGPTAQDFQAAFGLGTNDKTIASGNLDGVALAAIQGLNAKVEAQAREIAELRQALEPLLAAVKNANRIAARSP